MRRIWGWGLVRSMVISYRNLFRRKITVQYPHMKLRLPERARWAVEHKFYDDGQPKCTACMACVKACPDYIIDIQTSVADDKTKHIDRWRYEIGACMMCGLCVEACPFDAIRMGHNYELARIDPATLVVDLLVDVTAAQPKKRAEAEAARAAAASALAVSEGGVESA